MTVVRSTCPPFVGTRGIVLQETENVFRFITKQNLIKTIPKAVRKGFRCALPWCMVHGACFCGVCFFVHLLGEDQDALTCPWGREIIKREEKRDGHDETGFNFLHLSLPTPWMLVLLARYHLSRAMSLDFSTGNILCKCTATILDSRQASEQSGNLKPSQPLHCNHGTTAAVRLYSLLSKLQLMISCLCHFCRYIWEGCREIECLDISLLFFHFSFLL